MKFSEWNWIHAENVTTRKKKKKKENRELRHVQWTFEACASLSFCLENLFQVYNFIKMKAMCIQLWRHYDPILVFFLFPSSHDVSVQWQYSINTAKTTETDYQSISRLTISKENILSGTVKCWEKKLKTLSNNEIKTAQRAPDDCHNKHSPLWRLMGNWYMMEMLPLPTWCDIPAAFPTRTPGTEI